MLATSSLPVRRVPHSLTECCGLNSHSILMRAAHSQTLRNLLSSWSDDGPSRLQALQQENDRLRAALDDAQQVR